MQWYDLVFAESRSWRYKRHIIFWTVWWVYFATTFFYAQQGFAEAGTLKWIVIVLLKSFLLLLCHTFIVYTVIYFLLPRYFLRAKYFLFAAGLLAATTITIAS